MAIQLHKTIENEIKRKIREGELSPGDKLQPENTLMSEYNASKMTIRQCITNLVQEGIIYSIERVGNFVATPEVDKYIVHFDELKKIKYVDEVVVIKTHFAKDQEISMIFPDLKEHIRVYVIDRVFYSEEIPVALDQIFITYGKNTKITPDEMINSSFIELMSSKLTYYSVKNDLTFEAVACPHKSAGILNVPENEPVAIISQKYYGTNDQLLGYSKTTCRSEYIELNASNF